MSSSSSQEQEHQQLEAIEVELESVERGLLHEPRERRRRSVTASSGRATYNSIHTALQDLRTRFDSLHSHTETSEQLNQRLNLVERSHSARIPLRVLQQQQSLNTSHTDPLASVRASTLQRESSGRRPSLLVASRTRQVEGFQADLLDLHQASAALLSPVNEPSESFGSEQSSAVSSEASSSVKSSIYQKEDDLMELGKEEEDLKTETPVLLTSAGRQTLERSTSSLSGSVHLSSLTDTTSDTTTTTAGSIVYSWGSGLQSLHDDANDKTVVQAKVGSDSRIGRPNAPAVISVATSSTHTACATAQGGVYTCGWNKEGCVDPSLREEQIPRPFIFEYLGQNRIVQLSCGVDHTAALSANGSVLSWGSNQHGQLGHRQSNSSISTYCRPQGVWLGGGGTRAVAVACGHYYTLVLSTRLSVLVCGISQMTGGQENKDKQQLPRSLPALEGLPLVAIAAGDSHAVVLTAHGNAFAWGSNSYGCCGRPYPETLGMPVPIKVVDKEPTHQGVWRPDEVAIQHAACGTHHTVLVCKSGGLLVCGHNDRGQLGILNATSVTSVQPVPHPRPGRRFVTAEAGDGHSLLLDDVGDVYEMGNSRKIECVLSQKHIVAIAAGGAERIALAAGRNALRRQFSVAAESVPVDGSLIQETMEDLLEAVEEQQQDPNKDVDDTTLSPAGQELANRTEELLRYPAVLNGLFQDPSDLQHMYDKLVSIGNRAYQQAIATAVEKGIKLGIERLDPEHSRLIYPEAIRCLLIYLKFFDRKDNGKTVFDQTGRSFATLCETILGLQFEGYKAFLTWATSTYKKELFVEMLIRPLLVQLDKSVKVSVDADGVEHVPLSRKSVPLIVGVLRWLYKASERAGNIAAPEDFYSECVNKIPIELLYDDLAKYKKDKEAKRPTHRFFLSANSFLLTPGTKRNIIQMENQVEMMKVISSDVHYDEASHEYSINPFFVLEIERDHLMEQTLEKIKEAKPSELRKKLRVVFKGEEGVDAGGVSKEFFLLLSEDLFDVTSSLWTDRYGDEITWFNSDCTWDEEGYELVGLLVGLALYNDVLIDAHFPTAVYRKILGLPLGLEDMVDEELKKGLQQLLDYEGDDVEFIFCLSFEVTWMDLGEEKKVELKPGGSDIPVTSDNREEYVLLYVKWLLVDSIQPQWDAFIKGLMRIVESSSLDLLRPEELELLIVGTPDLDFKALQANTEYEGGYDKDSGVVQNFWRFAIEAPRETQIKLLKFTTGACMAPIGGLGQMPFKIQRAGPDSPQLPTSHTCFNTLLLPDYGSDYDKLSARLGRAILECEGFGLE